MKLSLVLAALLLTSCAAATKSKDVCSKENQTACVAELNKVYTNDNANFKAAFDKTCADKNLGFECSTHKIKGEPNKFVSSLLKDYPRGMVFQLNGEALRIKNIANNDKTN